MSSTSADEQTSAPTTPPEPNEFEVTLEDGSKLVIKLNWKDKFMRFLLSKQEFEARLLEKIEKAKAVHQKNLSHQTG